jgi:restriction endonuclease S subunit
MDGNDILRYLEALDPIMTYENSNTAPKELPAGWRWARLGEVCDINPSRPKDFKRATDTLTTFVPMAAVDGDLGQIVAPQQRLYGEVARGYTFFAEGDVLFAKITPCMQNKKSAIARQLIDGVGFGTTEFHVLRPHNEILAEWIYYQLREPMFLSLAEANFSGAVGQQRVPTSFLEQYQIPLPPLATQHAIARQLERDMAEVTRLRAAAERQRAALAVLTSAYLREVFEGAEARGWPIARLGDVLHLRKDVIHPYDNPSRPAIFVGLEHIEPHTGRRIGSLNLEMSTLSGRKPRFYQGDIVYGYLRPYLNKTWLAEFDGLCSVDQYVYLVNKEYALTEFIAAFMRSPIYLKRAPIDTTPGQLPRIRTEEVTSVELSLPPLSEQYDLVQKLEYDKAETIQIRSAAERQRQAIDAMPAALLREVFGEFAG